MKIKNWGLKVRVFLLHLTQCYTCIYYGRRCFNRVHFKLSPVWRMYTRPQERHLINRRCNRQTGQRVHALIVPQGRHQCHQFKKKSAGFIAVGFSQRTK
jgi:hypothetical protein